MALLESGLSAAVLALEDGSVFKGYSIGAEGISVGEVVFNTAMTGYQEIVSDPSYAAQIVTLTYPHIGNVGTNAWDQEAEKPWLRGLIVRDLSPLASNWRSETDLTTCLKRFNVVGIAGIDTRHLTRVLREKGALKGVIGAGPELGDTQPLVAKARAFAGLKGQDLAQVVSTEQAYAWKSGVWSLDSDQNAPQDSPLENARGPRYKVVAYDFGVKRNILRILVNLGCDVTVVPARTPASQVLAMKPDGVFLSNGPGDPEPCDYAIAAIKTLLDESMPLFGICLGHQLLALASGARTLKMKFGHHGANHPVQDLSSKRVMITSQNHGFCVDESGLPDCIRVTHRSLFDQTIQGIAITDRPAFSFQGHPEASPGPQDAEVLFNHFLTLMKTKEPLKVSQREGLS